MPAEYVLMHGAATTLEEYSLLEYTPEADPRRRARTRMAVARAISRAARRAWADAYKASDLRGQLAAEDEMSFAWRLRSSAHGQLVVLRRTAGLRVGPEGGA